MTIERDSKKPGSKSSSSPPTPPSSEMDLDLDDSELFEQIREVYQQSLLNLLEMHGFGPATSASAPPESPEQEKPESPPPTQAPK